MNPAITQKIYGPPGTGKTTKLLNIAEDLLTKGYIPRELCFVTFTKKGAAEARQRAIDKFQFEEKEFVWWRTLHSLAFNQLGLSRTQVMGFSDNIAICGQLGISITNKGMSDDGNITGLSKGDRLFFMENMARARMMTLRDYWEQNHLEDIPWYELERFANTINAYKQAQGKQDYTDIIYSFLHMPYAPPIKILIVDEAQDLTPLQWRMVDKLSEHVEQIYIAGDDDQAIFKWAGADVDHFIKIPGKQHVLPQSYRVPLDVQKIAEEIASKISNRVPKSWKPTDSKGAVHFIPRLEDIDMSTGEWLLLGRNLFTLEAYNQHCLDMGYVFDSHIGTPIKSSALTAIVAWEDLRKGKEIPGSLVKLVYDYFSVREQVRYGFKKQVDNLQDNEFLTLHTLREKYGLLTDKIWHEAFGRLPVHEREYFLSALRRGEKLLKKPRIKINTIHSVKGGECENVVILPDMAQRTFQEYQENPDDEHRVWYVAVTRTKKNLYILSPTTDKAYHI